MLSSIAFPAACKLVDETTPPDATIAMFVVPPPTSTTRCARSSSNARPAPIPAASPSSMRSVRRPPASYAASRTERCSTAVAEPGMPTTKWPKRIPSVTWPIKERSIFRVTSKLKIVPLRIGRCTSMARGSRPRSFNALWPTQTTSPS